MKSENEEQLPESSDPGVDIGPWFFNLLFKLISLFRTSIMISWLSFMCFVVALSSWTCDCVWSSWYLKCACICFSSVSAALRSIATTTPSNRIHSVNVKAQKFTNTLENMSKDNTCDETDMPTTASQDANLNANMRD